MSNSNLTSGTGRTPVSEEKRQLQGLMGALGAFTFWGIFPLYFKLLDGMPVLEILAHRIIWSLVLVGMLIYFMNKFRLVLETLSDPRTLMLFIGSTIVIAINWTTFVWSVSADRVLDASLGYYINPLVNVMLGMLFLGERLNKAQTTAILLAVVAVLLLSLSSVRCLGSLLCLLFLLGLTDCYAKKPQPSLP